MLKLLYLSMLFYLVGCVNTTTHIHQEEVIHKHIQKNKEEAKQAQEEYKLIKNKRINR
jgi:hypothetical protein